LAQEFDLTVNRRTQMLSPSSRLSPSATSPENHNVPKHPHAVQGERRAKHQPQAAGAPHTRHQLPSAKMTMRIVGSIRPPSAPLPQMEVLLPSKERAPEFMTYSPFDSEFPTFAASKAFKAVKSPVTVADVNLHHHVAKANAHHHAANDHAHHKNNRHLKQTPTEQAKKNKKHHVATADPKVKTQPENAVASSRQMSGKRMTKEHAQHLPRKLHDKRPWHLAGWVTYSPFDSNFDRVCNTGFYTNVAGVSVLRERKQRGPHAHHGVNQPHHPGHHQAHHKHGGMSPATKAIAEYYATPAMAAFPRMSPTAAQQTPAMSFFMPAPRLSVTAMPSNSMAGLPGSMLAFTARAPAFGSGIAW